MVGFIETIGLAFVDAINPCELAVMVMVLVALLMDDPTKRKRVLWGGFAFTLAVFLMYIIYGLILINVFSLIITGRVASIAFKIFGVLAILLGIFNLKDYFIYKPGGLATEMPMKLRPRVKLLIKRITSPKGAFIIGIFVSLFLLPCTMGPYLIFSGRVAGTSLLSLLPWILLYNIIFVLPMIAITLIIYFGFTTVEKVSGWKEMNIKKMHLVEGLILIILGILMVTGLI